MKANYLLKNRHGHPRLRRLAILLAILICGAFVFSFFEGPVISVISPFWKVENFLFNSRKALLEENAMLKERLIELERQKGRDTSLATVLARPPQTPYDIVIVDIGSHASVYVGSKVLLPEGEPIGLVFEVLGKQAKVKLFSTVEEETDAVLERHSVPVVLVGAGGGSFKITLPRDVAVEKGDRILSADEGSHLLAVVEDISIRATDSFKEILAKSPVNIFALRFVLITP